MTREEKMASRVLAIRKLVPPFDLVKLANEYGEVEFIELPFNADGITVGIGDLSKPKILINSDAVETRKKFTLAHEIGHIVIPWHTGTIVSHLEPGEEDIEYKYMEAEANRFAAELLMPTEWLIREFESSNSIEEYFKAVLDKSGASKDAAFFKIFKPLNAPVICLQLDSFSNVTRQARSLVAPYVPNITTFTSPEMIPFDHKFESFVIDERIYACWTFAGKSIPDQDPRTWREILEEILNDTNKKELLQSVNSTLAAAFNKNKALQESEICGAIIRSFASKPNFSSITSHGLFEQYIVKRVKELSTRK